MERDLIPKKIQLTIVDIGTFNVLNLINTESLEVLLTQEQIDILYGKVKGRDVAFINATISI